MAVEFSAEGAEAYQQWVEANWQLCEGVLQLDWTQRAWLIRLLVNEAMACAAGGDVAQVAGKLDENPKPVNQLILAIGILILLQDTRHHLFEQVFQQEQTFLDKLCNEADSDDMETEP